MYYVPPVNATVGTRTGLVEELIERYPEIPPEAVLKEDLLRTGIAFDDAALTENLEGEVKPKSYFIFSFDQKPLTELGAAALQRPPEEIALTGGPWELRRTIVSVRVNPESPYRVSRVDGRLRLSLEESDVAEVTTPPMPEYYRHELSNGKTVMETAPTIEWGYLIYLTVLRLCQYFGAKEECGFCDINHNWRQHRKAGRPYTGVKPVEDVLEALDLVNRYDDGHTHAYTLTGGSVTSTVDGLAEADFYGRYAQAIEERFPGRWIGKVVAQALPKADAQRFKDYGISIYHPNYEVWDKRLFSLISPGKERYVGREEWHRRILDAAEVFGPSHVIPNFVAGVELAKPFGFETIDEAIASTVEGLDYFMSHGVTPRFTTWCPEPTTRSAATTLAGRPWSTTCACWASTATRSRATASSPRPGTASRAWAARSSPSAPSWTCCDGRISVDEARELWLRGDDEELQRLAGEVRARYHEPDRATYMVMRIINYTNVCVAQCDYCAFYVLPNQDGGYVLSREDVFAKIDELLEFGGDLVGFNGGFNPRLPTRLLLRPVRLGARALRRPRRVLRAHRRGVRLPRRPRAAHLRRGRRAAARRGRLLDHRRRLGDPHRGLSRPARQVEVHRHRLLRRPARDR